MILKIEHLNKAYHGRQVLKDVSLQVKENEIVALLGPNGTGKTTLIQCICDLVIPDSGTIVIEGTLQPQSARVAFLPERSSLDPSWTALQAIRFFQDFYPDFQPDKARAILKDLELDENTELRSMSKGMQEKLQIALVMARRVRLYILDEPLGGVDPLSRDHILDTVLRNFEEGSSMILSTHLISDIERILDRVIMLEHGSIKIDEPADALRARRQKSIDEIYREVYSA